VLAQTNKQFKITDQEFERISKLIRDLSGISLKEHKKMLIVSRLSKRLRVLGLENFSDYYDLLTGSNEIAGQELTCFINGITTNKTDFYREPYQFDYLQEAVLEDLFNNPSACSDGELRIWSAGCSTGEEPYTIGIILSEYFKEKRSINIKILATDLDTEVLEKAKIGIYGEQAVRPIPPDCMIRYFKRGVGINEGSYMTKKCLKDIITFAKHNLVYSPMKVNKPFDIIFCRNVLIYFDEATTKNIIYEQFYNTLKAGGHLFLGHSESLSQNNTNFEHVANSVYRKRS
jgi:chemotaxis protein methyltransferase CheR